MKFCIYRVNGQKSLAEVAAGFNTNSKLIKQKNNLECDSVYNGMRLVIPIIEGEEYVVKPFDSLEMIGKKYNLPPQIISNYNNLTSESVFIGQKLFIPCDFDDF